MSEASWYNVEKILKETLGLGDAQITWLGAVRSELRGLASAGIATSPDFTLHSEIHSDDVVVLCRDLVKLLVPGSKLSEYEIYVLVAAAYLHDVGMFIGAKRFNDEVLPDLAASLRFCAEDCCDGGSKYQSAIVGRPVDQQIRAVHHLLTAYLLTEDGENAFRLYSKDAPHVITVCRGHRKADLRNPKCGCYKTRGTKLGEVRRDLLAAILRLADALDFYPERAPEGVFRTRAPDFLGNPIALKNWLNHYFATSVHLAIGDDGGNRYLDCQLRYTLPTRWTLNGRSYKEFLTPLFNEFLEEARKTDYNVEQYPQAFLEAFGIRNIQLNIEILSEPGAVRLPERMVKEIDRSGSRDILEFLVYLGSEKTDSASSPPSEQLMDRYPEARSFQTMLEGKDPPHRLMCLVGEHGQGKTWLMNLFEQSCRQNQVLCARMDLSEVTDFVHVLDRIWRRLGPHRFSIYSARRSKEGPVERQELTGCFFDDWLRITNRPRFVILLDTYEKADPTLQDWIETEFLNGLKVIEEIIVVIGGRKWPEIDDYWQRHGYSFPLEGVQVSDYREFAERHKVTIPEGDLVKLHQAMKGLPKLFAEYVAAKGLAGGAR